MQTSNICVLPKLFCLVWHGAPYWALTGSMQICKQLQPCELCLALIQMVFFLRCRWAAEPAAARRTDRDRLSKERLRARQRGSGLPAHAYRAEPLSEMTRKCGLWLICLSKPPGPLPLQCILPSLLHLTASCSLQPPRPRPPTTPTSLLRNIAD